MKQFEQEKGKFYFLPIMEKEENSITRKKEDVYWISRAHPDYPTWIWTKENLTEEEYKEIRNILVEEYLQEEAKEFTSKEEFYQRLSKDIKTTDYFEMGYLECSSLKKIDCSPGFMDQPKYSDITVLAQYWTDECQETPGLKSISLVDSMLEIKEMIKENCFYIWRDKKGRAVSMASYSIEDNLAKISHVYTPKEERRKGYCKSLIYCLTKKLLEEGYLPMLYTDYHYEVSNHTYEKVGYEKKGILINFKMKKGE